MKLDAIRTPGANDAVMIRHESNGEWTVWDNEWDTVLCIYVGENAERLAKADAIDYIIERYGQYDGREDPVHRDEEGLPL